MAVKFRQQPFGLLDRQFDRDRQWERGVVERLRRGEAGPRGVSIYDVVESGGEGLYADGSWEAIEKRAAKADRSGSPFLNDIAIARRAEERKAQREAWAAWRAEQAAIWEREKVKRAEEHAAKVEAQRLYREELKRRAAEKAERDAEWERLGKTLVSWRTEAGAEKAAKRRFDEERAILMNKWQCVKCKRVAQIKTDGDGYLMSCISCGVEAHGLHSTLVLMLPAVA